VLVVRHAAEELPQHVLAPALGNFFVAEVEAVLDPSTSSGQGTPAAYSRLVINRMGSRGRPALLRPAPTTATVGPNRSTSSLAWPARSLRANIGASAASISFQGSRVASTANGSLRLIIASIRQRKKSVVSILESLRNSTPLKSNLRELHLGIHPRKPASMRAVGVLQGRLSRRRRSRSTVFLRRKPGA
jgi:hypothetical protein